MIYKGSIHEELKGFISVRLHPNKVIDEFCEKYFNNYNRDQFEAIAIRLYHGKETIVTLYALDKIKQEGTNFNPNKLPVKKFKSNVLTLNTVLSYMSEFNFTLTVGNYSLQDIEVMNK